eukprot:244703-Rhodomonas_salina.1
MPGSATSGKSTLDSLTPASSCVLTAGLPTIAQELGSLPPDLTGSDPPAPMIQGQPVPVTVFRSGVSPPTELDLPVAWTDASIPLPGTLGDPPPRLPGTWWHTSNIAQVPPQQACLQEEDAKHHLCFLSADRWVG